FSDRGFWVWRPLAALLSILLAHLLKFCINAPKILSFRRDRDFPGYFVMCLIQIVAFLLLVALPYELFPHAWALFVSLFFACGTIYVACQMLKGARHVFPDAKECSRTFFWLFAAILLMSCVYAGAAAFGAPLTLA